MPMHKPSTTSRFARQVREGAMPLLMRRGRAGILVRNGIFETSSTGYPDCAGRRGGPCGSG